MAGMIALVKLTAHGALYAMNRRKGNRAFAPAGSLGRWTVQALLSVVRLIATYSIEPEVIDHYSRHPISILIPLAGACESRCHDLGYREGAKRSLRS